MPDIFGREAGDYEVVRALQDANQWDAYQRGAAEQRPGSAPTHDFNALGGGVPEIYQRATQDQQAVGYITNNLLAIQTMVDEILYTAYRLPQFIDLNTSIPEGAQTYGVRIRDRVGMAERISGPGFEAPSATVSETIVTMPIYWYGLDAEWAIDELRGAMMAGTALDTDSVDAAVTGTLERMEYVGLIGEYGEPGLLTLPTTGDNAVTHMTADSPFSDMTGLEIRNLINGRLSAIIENSQETIGRNLMSGMTVFLPGTQYDLLTTLYIGDNAEITLMEAIMRDNPWTHFTGQALNIERVLELSSGHRPGATTDRMVVGLKNNRVAEMGVSISPRVLSIINKGRVVCAQVEAKFSPVFSKRPNTMHYVDGI